MGRRWKFGGWGGELERCEYTRVSEVESQPGAAALNYNCYTLVSLFQVRVRVSVTCPRTLSCWELGAGKPLGGCPSWQLVHSFLGRGILSGLVTETHTQCGGQQLHPLPADPGRLQSCRQQSCAEFFYFF